MTQHYPIRCHECDEVLPVPARHAGSSVPCPQCSATVEIPKLRVLRQLEPIHAEEKAGHPGWGRVSGAMFALGLLLLAIAVGSGFYVRNVQKKYQAYTTKPNAEDFTYGRDMLSVSLTDSWQAWEQFVADRNIEDRVPPIHVRAREGVKRLDQWLYFFCGLATVGILSAIGSLLCRPKSAV